MSKTKTWFEAWPATKRREPSGEIAAWPKLLPPSPNGLPVIGVREPDSMSKPFRLPPLM
jgi:hypothetical protein